MLNVRLAGDHPFRKLLCTWLSLAISLIVSYCAVITECACVCVMLNLVILVPRMDGSLVI